MTLDELIEKIKLSGGRTTKTRLAALKYLLAADRPVSPAEILGALKQKRVLVNRTTVYRELAFLAARGLVREVGLVGQPALFELVRGHRHHLICLKCNKIKTIVMANHLHKEEEKITKKEKFKITDHCLEFYGLCQDCRRR
ncbi:MAG: transcriptional repressor [Patescibacteria group bacterium]